MSGVEPSTSTKHKPKIKSRNPLHGRAIVTAWRAGDFLYFVGVPTWKLVVDNDAKYTARPGVRIVTNFVMRSRARLRRGEGTPPYSAF